MVREAFPKEGINSCRINFTKGLTPLKKLLTNASSVCQFVVLGCRIEPLCINYWFHLLSFFVLWICQTQELLREVRGVTGGKVMGPLLRTPDSQQFCQSSESRCTGKLLKVNQHDSYSVVSSFPNLPPTNSNQEWSGFSAGCGIPPTWPVREAYM